MVFGAIAAIGLTAYGMYQSHQAGRKQRAAITALGKFNAKAIGQDIALLKEESRYRKSVIRNQRAAEHQVGEAAAVASGVDLLRSGSVQDALLFNAEQLAREEFAVDREVEQNEKRLKTELKLSNMEGRGRRDVIKANTTAALIGGAASIFQTAGTTDWSGK